MMRKIAEYKELIIGLIVCLLIPSSGKGILVFMVLWYAQKFYFEYRDKEIEDGRDIIELFKRIEPKRKFKLIGGKAVEQYREKDDSVPDYL
jgi:hypothetical protein